MTQRIFDVDNPQDIKDLFDILPNIIVKIKWLPTDKVGLFDNRGLMSSIELFRIAWRDKTEITRPVDETQWFGKLCWFQEEKDTMPFIGVLESITGDKYKCEAHLTPCKVCRPVRRDEIKFVEDEK